jgi:hypothetical protein
LFSITLPDDQQGAGKTILHYDIEIDPVVKVTNQK